MITKTEAIRSLSPGAKFTNVHDVITWYSDDITQPSDSDVDSEIIRLQAEYDAQEYARNREAEYPSIEECVHAILDDQLDALQVKRQAVKAKYPKP